MNQSIIYYYGKKQTRNLKLFIFFCKKKNLKLDQSLLLRKIQKKINFTDKTLYALEI